jgi:4-amino-4-deoxy-L-arabinose transferase-like glycosyltransferase
VLRSIALVALLSAGVFLVALGSPAITESDEAFYAEASREMVASGDWVTPRFNYEHRFQKPILYYWLASAGYLAAGVNEAMARLPSALAGVWLALTSLLIARRWYGETTGTLAGGIVATSFGYFAMARQALPDLPLAGFVTIATWAALEAASADARVAPRTRRRWLLAAAAAAALAFLMKGPVGLILPGLIAVPVAAVEWRRAGRPVLDVLRELGWAAPAAAVLFLAIVAPWYAAMVEAHGLWYLRHFFIGENVERFATDRYNDPRPFWFYVPVVLGGMAPWTPLMALWLPPLREIARGTRAISPVEIRLAAWAAVPLLFYTASVGKQPRYVLPVLPPLAILLARAIARHVADRRRGEPARLLRAAGTASGLLLALCALGLWNLRPVLVAALHSGPGAAALCIAAAAALIIVCALARPAWLPPVLAAAALVTLLLVQLTVFRAPRPEPVEQLAAAIARDRQPGEAVAAYRIFVRNLIFYTHAKQTEIFADEGVVDFLGSSERVFLVIEADDLARVERLPGYRGRRLMSVRFFDPARLRLDALFDPDPDRQLGTAVLVTNR